MGKPLRLRHPTGLHRNHRLGAGRHPHRRHEAAGIGNVFDVQENRTCLCILRQVVDQVVVIDIHAIAQGQEVGKPHTTGECPVDDRTGDGAGLANEGNPARDGAHMGVGSVQAACRDHQANGVGAQNPDSGLPGRFTNGIHQGLAGFTVST